MNWGPAMLLIGLCLMTSACSEETKPSDDRSQTEIPQLNAQTTPSSARSEQVIARLAPSLLAQLEDHKLKFGAAVFIRIFKEERQLELWMKGEEGYRLFRTYRIAGMSGKLGPKLREGDRQAPEGFYHVNAARMNPNSSFHLSFNLGYPNAYDRAHGRTGSALMVHGANVSIGCFAMTDPKIEEIYTLCDAALRGGQNYFRVHCFPFRMKEANMAKYKNSEWIDFWRNLKTGYDWFEKHGSPPNVEVENKRYTFSRDD